MAKELIISSTSLETKLAILEEDQVTQIFVERKRSRGILGNIYKGKVARVLPGMQAAFVDIGLERNAFLYVSDFTEDLEEYEELFISGSDPVEDSLSVSVEQDEPRSSRRGRRSAQSKNVQKSKDPEAKKPRDKSRQQKPQPVPEKKPEKKAAPVLTYTAENSAPRILPERIETVSRTGNAGRGAEAQPIPLSCDILPFSIPQIAQQNTPAIKSKENPGMDSGKQAELAESPVSFAAPRSSGKSRDRKKSTGRNSHQLIGDLLKEGQEILVQIAKEPIGKKGARITSHIVLPARYLVFMPTVDHVGVSRRISSSKERHRLRDIISSLRGSFEKGFIVRTAGDSKPKSDFEQDMIYLTRLWEQVRNKADRKSAPSLVHSELDLVQRIVRDYFSKDFSAIRVDDEQEYERLVEFISNFNPDLVKKVRLYSKKNPIFDEFGVTTEIEQALKTKVWLRNGGYIDINQTEALVAVDVNTGKYVGKTNSLEDTITKTNLDAVREVARQIRLRDLGGIIVLDLIDMNDPKNRQKVMDALLAELSKDKAPSKVLPFNDFGLVSITRKRVKKSLERTLCQPCYYCEGTGLTKSARTICYNIHQEVTRSLPMMGDGQELVLRCHPEIGRALRENEKDVSEEIKEMTGKILTIRTDPLMHIEKYDLIEA